MQTLHQKLYTTRYLKVILKAAVKFLFPFLYKNTKTVRTSCLEQPIYAIKNPAYFGIISNRDFSTTFEKVSIKT